MEQPAATMPSRSHDLEVAFIDLVSSDDDDNDNCRSKCPRTSRSGLGKKSGSSENALSTLYSCLPPKKRPMHINIGSSRGCTNKDELDTETFEICMEDVWTSIDLDKKINYEYFDSLWFYIYTIGNDKNKSDVLERIKDKKIFSKQYVFVPIILWGHWNLLVLCNFGEKNYLGTKKGPRMLLLDSLETTNPTRLQSAISKFIVGILKSQEREEFQQFIKEVKLEISEVPQQSGRMDCGIYVLYFVFCILFIEKLGEDLSQLDALFHPEVLKIIEGFRRDIHSFLHKRDAKKNTQSRGDGRIEPSILSL